MEATQAELEAVVQTVLRPPQPLLARADNTSTLSQYVERMLAAVEVVMSGSEELSGLKRALGALHSDRMSKEQIQASLKMLNELTFFLVHLPLHNSLLSFWFCAASNTVEVSVMQLQFECAVTMAAVHGLAVTYPTTATTITLDDLMRVAEPLGEKIYSLRHPDPTLTQHTTKRRGVEETREIRSTKYVSEWILPVLAACSSGGAAGDPRPFKKHIRDESIWVNAEVQWRRNPAYLCAKLATHYVLLRVCVCTEQADNTYKLIMLEFVRKLLEDSCQRDERGVARHERFPATWLPGLQKKLTRMLVKLDNVESLDITSCTETIEAAHKEMERFSKTQNVRIGTFDARYHPSAEDTVHEPDAVRSIQEFIALTKTKSSQSTCALPPSITPSRDPLCPYSTLAWLRQEESKVRHRYGDPHEGNARAIDESEVNGIVKRMHSYWQEAERIYEKDPVSRSRMVVTLLTFLAMIDNYCCKHVDLLGQHPLLDESTFHDVLDDVLCVSKGELQQVRLLQKHFKRRCLQRSGHLPLLSNRKEWSGSFEERYSGKHFQPERMSIKSAEEEAKCQKLGVIDEMIQEVDAAWEEYDRAVHSCGWSTSCSKCDLEKECEWLEEEGIERFCEYLPREALEANVVTFELCRIGPVVALRAAIKIVSEALGVGEERKTTPWRECRDLVRFRRNDDVDTCNMSISIASESEAHFSYRSHYSRTTVLSSDAKTPLPVGGNVVFSYRVLPYKPLREDVLQRLAFGTEVDSVYDESKLAMFMRSAEHDENVVQAAQRRARVNLPAFIAFGTLRSGIRLQWRRIMGALEIGELDLADSSVCALLLQAVWQACPSTDLCDVELEGIRESHLDVLDQNVRQVTLDICRRKLEGVERNWSSYCTCVSIVALLHRMLQVSDSDDDHDEISKTLDHCASLSTRWVEQVELKYIEAPEDMQERLRPTLAGCCLAGLFALCGAVLWTKERAFASLRLQAVFSSYRVRWTEERAFAWLKLQSVFSSYTAQDVSSLQKLGHVHYPLVNLVRQNALSQLDSMIEQFPSLCAVKKVVSKVITSRSFEHCQFEKIAGTSHWIRADVSSREWIDVDLLRGSILLNGRSQVPLPVNVSIATSASYQQLFSSRVVMVTESSSGRYDTVKPVDGAHFTFQRIDSEIAIFWYRVRDDRRVEESELLFIQRDLLPADHFPYELIHEYSHWLDAAQGALLFFRPHHLGYAEYKFDMQRMTLERVGGSDSSDSRTYIVARTSGLFRHYRHHVFSRLDSDENVVPRWTVGSRDVSVVFPQLNCDFILHTDRGVVTCSQFNDRVMAEEQEFGALSKLHSGVVLRADDGSKVLLVPRGKLQKRHKQDSFRIESDGSGTHAFEIDEDLGGLRSPDLLGWLFISLLSACTSTVVDRLTGMTGVEYSLHVMDTRCRSDKPYNDIELRVFENVFEHCPKRSYYPPSMRLMEHVQWSSHSLVSDNILLAATDLLKESQEMKFLHAPDYSPPLPTSNEQELHERAYEQARLIATPYEVLPWRSDAVESSCAMRCSAMLRLPQSNVLSFAHSAFTNSATVCEKLTVDKIWTSRDLVKHYNTLLKAKGDAVLYSLEVGRLVIDKYDDVLINFLMVIVREGIDLLGDRNMHNLPIRHSYNIHQSDIRDKVGYVVHSRNSRIIDAYHRQWPTSNPTRVGECPYTNHCAVEKLFQETYSFYKTRLFVQSLIDRAQRATRLRARRTLTADVWGASAPLERECCNALLCSLGVQWADREDLHSNDALVIDRLLNSRCCDLVDNSGEHTVPAAATRCHEFFNSKRLDSLFKQSEKNNAFSLDVQRKSFEEGLASLGHVSQRLCSTTVEQHIRKMLEDESDNVDDALSTVEDRISLWIQEQFSRAKPYGLSRQSSVMALKLSSCTKRAVLSIACYDLANTLKRSEAALSTLSRAVLAWAVVKCYRQQLRRLRMYEEGGELASVMLKRERDNPVFSAFAPLEEPMWVLLQLNNNFSIRAKQVDVARHLMKNVTAGNNVTMQLNMGEGKTYVITPMLMCTWRNVRVTVLTHLYHEHGAMWRERIGGMLGMRMLSLPVSRGTQLEKDTKALQKHLQRCKDGRGVLLVTPEDRLSLQLKVTMSNNAELHSFFASYNETIDILDECDELLDPKYQLVYTLDTQQAVDGGAARWIAVGAVLRLLKKHAHAVAQKYERSDIVVKHGERHSFPSVELYNDSDVHHQVFMELSERIAADVVRNAEPTVFDKQLGEKERQLVKLFLTSKELSEQDERNVNGFFTGASSEQEKEANAIGLLLLYAVRGLLGHGVLRSALSLRYRVSYGRGPAKRTDGRVVRTAVPYRAKDVASERAEFGHKDMQIVLTFLTYFYNGLSDAEFNEAIQVLGALQNPAEEYSKWVALHAPKDISPAVRTYDGLNFNDYEQLEDLRAIFRFNTRAIELFLARRVFPAEVKEFPRKLSASAWDLLCGTTVGFSGTNESSVLLPSGISQRDLPQEKSTNVRLTKLLIEQNGYKKVQGDKDNLIDLLVQHERQPSVFIDVGAIVMDLSNREVAQRWLTAARQHYDRTVEAAVFFGAGGFLVVLYPSGRTEMLRSSPMREKLSNCVVFLDQAHTRGTDLRFSPTAHAVVSLGSGVCRDHLAQGCMRMRLLEHGQTISFLAAEPIDKALRKLKGDSGAVDAMDVMRWAYHSSRTQLAKSMRHWTAQGLSYARSMALENTVEMRAESDAPTLRDLYGGSITTQKFASHVRQSLSDGRDVEIFETICDRLDEAVPDLVADFSVHDEQQERELEAEQEQEVQRDAAPPANPVKPVLCESVKQMRISDRDSGAIVDCCSVWRNANDIPDVTTREWVRQPVLTCSREFCSVILGDHTSSYFLRRPNWVAVSISDAAVRAMLLSGYEADQLLRLCYCGESEVPKGWYLAQWEPRKWSTQELDILQCTSLWKPLWKGGEGTHPSSAAELRKLPQFRSLVACLQVISGSMYFSRSNRERFESEWKEYCGLLSIALQPWSAEEVAAGTIQPNGFRSGSQHAVFAFQFDPHAFVEALIAAHNIPIDLGDSCADVAYILRRCCEPTSEFEQE